VLGATRANEGWDEGAGQESKVCCGQAAQVVAEEDACFGGRLPTHVQRDHWIMTRQI
jgi:hypothetical protein